jgi:hypothetical protein
MVRSAPFTGKKKKSSGFSAVFSGFFVVTAGGKWPFWVVVAVILPSRGSVYGRSGFFMAKRQSRYGWEASTGLDLWPYSGVNGFFMAKRAQLIFQKVPLGFW